MAGDDAYLCDAPDKAADGHTRLPSLSRFGILLSGVIMPAFPESSMRAADGEDEVEPSSIPRDSPFQCWGSP